MTDDFGAFTGGSTLVIQRWLPGPVKRIWNFIVDGDLRRKWLAAGDIGLAPGAPVELIWRNDEISDPADRRPPGFPEEQRMPSHVIAVDPMRSLTIAWGAGAVTFELTEQGERVLLTLTHTGLEDRGARTKICAGWHMHLDILAAEAAGAKPPSFWSGWATLKNAYEQRLSP